MQAEEEGKQLTPLSFSTLSHTGLKEDRKVGHGNGMIYLRQVAPRGVSSVPGDTLFSVHCSLSVSLFLTHCKCTCNLNMYFGRKEHIKMQYSV